MKNNVRLYRDAMLDCYEKINIPISVFSREDEQNVISLFEDCNFESVVQAFGEMYFDDLMKNGGEDKKIFVDTLKKYDIFIAENPSNTEDMSRLASRLFAVHIISSLHNLKGVTKDTQSKASTALLGSWSIMESYKRAYIRLGGAIPDELKRIFVKWQGGSSLRDMLSGNYKDLANKYLKDKPVMLERFSEEQNQLFKEFKQVKGLNDVQVDFCVQMLSRYALNYSKDPVRELFRISPVVNLGVDERFEVSQIQRFQKGLDLDFSDDKGVDILGKLSGFLDFFNYDKNQTKEIKELQSSGNKAQLMEFDFSSGIDRKYSKGQLLKLGAISAENKLMLENLMVLGVKKVECQNGTCKMELVVCSNKNYDMNSLRQMNKKFLEKVVKDKILMPKDTIKKIVGDDVAVKNPLDNNKYYVGLTNFYETGVKVFGNTNDMVNQLTEAGVEFGDKSAKLFKDVLQNPGLLKDKILPLQCKDGYTVKIKRLKECTREFCEQVKQNNGVIPKETFYEYN